MTCRYISNGCWLRVKPRSYPLGTYVIATKYKDGDPGDQFCVGFYNGAFEHYGETRHLVVDSNGNNFRHNGFRRIQKISAARGTWIVQHLLLIEAMKDTFSVWHWVRAPVSELESRR